MFPAKRICSAVCSLYSPVCLILQPRLGARQTSCLLSRLLFFSLHFGPPLFAWIWPIDAGSLNQHLLEAAVMTSSIIWPRLFLSYGLISFHKQRLCRASRDTKTPERSGTQTENLFMALQLQSSGSEEHQEVLTDLLPAALLLSSLWCSCSES